MAASVAMAAVFTMAASGAEPEKNCQQFRAMSSNVFDNKKGVYSGPLWAQLGDEVLIGKILPSDAPPVTTCDAVFCQDTGFKMTLDFGKGDRLTMETPHAVYNMPGGLGWYYSTAKVIAGTGRFAKATGLLFEQGPFIAWMDEKGEIQAQYNGETGGSICGVEPQSKAATLTSPEPTTAFKQKVSSFQKQRLTPSARK